MSRLGQLVVGRIPLGEPNTINYQVNAASGIQSISLTGQEAGPPSETFRALAEDLVAMLGSDIPVTFSQKSNHDGLYRVSDVGAPITEFAGHAYGFTWNLTLQRIGANNAIDIESRFTDMVRTNAFALSGTRWHSPAIVAYGYDAPVSGSLMRAVEGEPIDIIRVYLGIPVGRHPHWGTTALDLRRGRVRFLLNGIERTGIGTRIPTYGGWSLTNGIVRISPSLTGGDFLLESWDGIDQAWDPQEMEITAGGSGSDFVSVTVLQNDFEAATIRILRDLGPGRVLVDLTIRRGSRVVEGFVQSTASNTIQVKTLSAVTTANNAASGYIVATGNTALGNRFTSGSPIAFTGSLTGSILKTVTTQFPFYAGHVIGGGAPVAGDSATDLRDQYIGTPASSDQAVKR
jgi:hypothetical protein